MSDTNQKQGEQKQRSGGSSLPEKVTLGVSVLVILGIIGFLLWHGLRMTRPPDTEAAPLVTGRIFAEQAARRDGFWVVPVAVRNVGNVPMEEVSMTVEWTNAEGQKSETDIMFHYLAEGATDDAFVVLDQGPEKAMPKVTVKSFKIQRDARGY